MLQAGRAAGRSAWVSGSLREGAAFGGCGPCGAEVGTALARSLRDEAGWGSGDEIRRGKRGFGVELEAVDGEVILRFHDSSSLLALCYTLVVENELVKMIAS